MISEPGSVEAEIREQRERSPWVMLGVATVGFAVNFWAWALISPLGPLFRDQGTLGELTESDVALLVAVPGARRVAGPDPRRARSPTATAAG